MSARARAALLAAGAVLTTAVGFVLGVPWLLPLLGAAVPYPVFLLKVRAGEYGRAVGWVLGWAVVQSLAMVAAVLWFPERAAEVVLTGEEYAAEMLHWVRTGEGPEGSPRLFLPLHLRHLAGFAGLCVLSAGALGIALGTFLLNYMNYYVATLIAASASPGFAAVFGWPVWAVLRVAGFITLGAGLTRVALNLYARLRGGHSTFPVPRRVIGVGLALVVADAVLKATLAPAWRSILLRALEGP